MIIIMAVRCQAATLRESASLFLLVNQVALAYVLKKISQMHNSIKVHNGYYAHRTCLFLPDRSQVMEAHTQVYWAQVRTLSQSRFAAHR